MYIWLNAFYVYRVIDVGMGKDEAAAAPIILSVRRSCVELAFR